MERAAWATLTCAALAAMTACCLKCRALWNSAAAFLSAASFSWCICNRQQVLLRDCDKLAVGHFCGTKQTAAAQASAVCSGGSAANMSLGL